MMNREPKCIQWKRQGAQRVMSKTANMSREQELAFWREKTEQLRARVMTQTKHHRTS
uniref:Uncharacterized protein n=1 Tax=Candidatus Kentrum sp. FM TaxID=2126340 RepID=A0A450TTN1_9GAMM|nr:MAG: hypothetical protein BECKFM1743A_GA0114220_106223 [Candidatus Kentron sp. FM]VFJ72446.1 MAG: hypothetical protein BECKFM1743C_GA0114222_106544 [Candidatus Kentron sp. FM]VFK19881.1 MAG: hypothetical protein BECKFM1743B_GA0114221_106524 [Candidatus Kentron sp. FM]